MTEKGSEISPLSKPNIERPQINHRRQSKPKEHEHSLFRYFRLVEQKTFTDENGNLKTELTPFVPKSHDGEIISLSVEGLNLIKHWLLLRSRGNGGLEKGNLGKINEEFKLIKLLYEKIKINFKDKKGNEEESEENLYAKLKEDLSKVQMVMGMQLINEPFPIPINIVIKNDDQIRDYLKRTSGLRHNIGGAMTPPFGNVELISKYPDLHEKYKFRIIPQLRRARKAIDREIRKLFGDVLDEYMRPSDIERLFLDDLVPIMKEDEEEGKQFDFNINIDEKVKNYIYFYCSEEHISSIFENIASNLLKIYKARDAMGGEQSRLPKMVIMDIQLSEDKLYLEVRIRDTGMGFEEEYLEKGFEDAIKSGYKAEELKKAGHEEIESHGIGMKEETEALKEKYGGRIIPGNYKDTIIIGGKPVEVSGGEQIIYLPISMPIPNTHPKGVIGGHLR